jgi:hypothetical protein
MYRHPPALGMCPYFDSFLIFICIQNVAQGGEDEKK